VKYVFMICAVVAGAALSLLGPHQPLASEPSQATGMVSTGHDHHMYMVRRFYDFTKDIPATRSAKEAGHQAHLLKFGQTVVSSALLAEDGARIGSVSISNIHDEAEINRYVYDDPYTRGGIYKSITIEPVDVYKIDGSYNRAPAWFAPELELRQKANGFDQPVEPTGSTPAKAMYLIRKDCTDRDKVDALIKRLQKEHYTHLITYGRNVVSASVKDGKGVSTQSIAIGDYETWADVARFVYQDPYTLNGMFSGITIERVDLYKLDGSFERAPAWFYDQMKARQKAPADDQAVD
jgi:uncharacterized protein YciI